MTAPGADLASVVNARVLIVEDEKIIARDIEQTLGELGYHVIGIVDTAEEAVRRALDERPDLILMDIHLRGEMDGIQAAEQIHQQIDVPVVFLTAFADEGTLARARAAAPYGYVLKPFDDRDLHVATMMALCKHRAFVELDRRVQERTEELVRSEARFRQVAALADLGVFALRTQDLQPVLDRAIAVAAETLGIELVKVVEVVDEGAPLLLRAGLGWRDGLVGKATLGIDRGSQAGFTLASNAPVVVDDLRTEDRFTPPEMLREHQVVSGVSVVILSPGDEHPYGVFCVHTRARRTFTSNEISFLQAVANLVGATVARVRAEERRLAAERSAEKARAREANAQEAIRLRDEFLAVASHELKTPLTALQLQLQSLAARIDSLDQRLVTKIERATRSTDRLASLVEALLDVSRLTLGRIELKPEELVLQDVAREVIGRVSEAAAKAGCQVRLVDRTGGALAGQWDRARLEQMLLNLLGNALKYAAGCPVHVSLDRVADGAQITVQDSGPGISPEHAERIFGRFERAASIRHYGGLGLGLYLTRQLAEAHGGTISVQSSPGGGASFILRLPLHPRPPEDDLPREVRT